MNEVQSKNYLHARQGTKLDVGIDYVVWAYSGSVVYASSGSIVYAYKGSRVYAYDGSIVYAYEGSEVLAAGTAVVNVAEYGAYVEGGDRTTLRLGCGVTALVKARANVHLQDAHLVTLGSGSPGRSLSVVCRAGSIVYGGIGNTLYVERGAIYH